MGTGKVVAADGGTWQRGGVGASRGLTGRAPTRAPYLPGGAEQKRVLQLLQHHVGHAARVARRSDGDERPLLVVSDEVERWGDDAWRCRAG